MFLSLSYPSGVLICVCYTYYSPTIFGSCILVLFSLCFSVLEVAVERASSSQSPSLAVSCCQQAHQRLLHFWDSVFGLQHVFVIPRISHRSCNSSDRPPPLVFHDCSKSWANTSISAVSEFWCWLCLFEVVLAVWSSLRCQVHFRMGFSFSAKSILGILTGTAWIL